ncbi:MAG: peptidase M15, partial [Deltaproteobacteria bacterium]|nr:peptidase M15 [Kofleriaceae bacterium]
HATLRAAMVAAGFEPMATEWWHYDAAGWAAYPLSDEPLR